MKIIIFIIVNVLCHAYAKDFDDFLIKSTYGPNSGPSMSIESHNENIWASGYYKGVYYFDNNEWKLAVQGLNSEEKITKLYSDGQYLWAGSKQGSLYLLNNQRKWNKIELPQNLQYITDIYRSGNKLYIISFPSYLFVLNIESSSIIYEKNFNEPGSEFQNRNLRTIHPFKDKILINFVDNRKYLIDTLNPEVQSIVDLSSFIDFEEYEVAISLNTKNDTIFFSTNKFNQALSFYYTTDLEEFIEIPNQEDLGNQSSRFFKANNRIYASFSKNLIVEVTVNGLKKIVSKNPFNLAAGEIDYHNNKFIFNNVFEDIVIVNKDNTMQALDKKFATEGLTKLQISNNKLFCINNGVNYKSFHNYDLNTQEWLSDINPSNTFSMSVNTFKVFDDELYYTINSEHDFDIRHRDNEGKWSKFVFNYPEVNLNHNTVLDFQIFDGNYFICGKEGVFYSDNFGQSWKKVPNLEKKESDRYIQLKSDDNFLYVLSENNILYNFNFKDGVNSTANDARFFTFESDTFLIIDSQGDPYYSFNSGKELQKSNNGNFENFSWIDFKDNTAIAVLESNEILYSTNTGKTWNLLPEDYYLKTKINQIVHDKNYFYFGTDGYGLWKLKVDESWIFTSVEEEKLSKLYLNTFNDYFEIKNPDPGIAEIRILDLNGKLIIRSEFKDKFKIFKRKIPQKPLIAVIKTKKQIYTVKFINI